MAGFRIAPQLKPDQTPKAKPKKVASYLAFIHQLPCIVTGENVVEAAHVSFASPKHGHYGRGKGHKASDRWAVPLSPASHRRQHSMNESEFWQSVGINPHEIALVIWGLWTEHGESAQPYAEAVIRQQLFAKDERI